MSEPDRKDTSFEEQANQQDQSLVGELIQFLREEKKWWLTPILIVLLLLGILMIFGGSGAAPYIYTLF